MSYIWILTFRVKLDPNKGLNPLIEQKKHIILMDNTEQKSRDLRQKQGHMKGLAASAQAEGISIEQQTYK